MNYPRRLGGDVADKIAEGVADAGNYRGAQPAYALVIVALEGGGRAQELNDEAVDHDDQHLTGEHRLAAPGWPNGPVL